MPSIRIDAGAHLRGRQNEVMAAVNSATLEPLGVSPADNDLVMACHDPQTRIVPEGRSERFCLIEIKMLAGRSDLQKKQLRTAIGEALAGFGLGETDIKMITLDIPRGNLGR
ncbi:MAG: tautomerase family protein [Rhizobiales bacterium]|nr:tautomerase family protein [Hyphomicrobiales bacterium]